MNLSIVTLPGDGVGPEVTAAAVQVARTAAASGGHRLEVAEYPIGWQAILATGVPLPADTIAACDGAQAVLLGAVGHPDADRQPISKRPEDGLLALRKQLGCFANLRPARLSPHLIDASPLRADVVRGTDILVVRELAGGIYYGEQTEAPDRSWASNAMIYRDEEVRRVARYALQLAELRRGDVVSVDKANVLAVSRLWRRVVEEEAREWPGVECRHMLVDRTAMELVFRPTAFDVLLTGNLFGDILSDQAAAVVGSVGMLGSASLGGTTDLYEPVHGSAPDIAGRDQANPAGAITSVAMMFRYTFDLEPEAARIERALEAVLAQGFRTRDIATPHASVVGTQEFGDLVVQACDTEAPAHA